MRKTFPLIFLIPIILIAGCTTSGQTSTTMAKYCGADAECFSNSIKTCEKAEINLGVAGASYVIEGKNDTNHCKVRYQANSTDNKVLSEGYCYIDTKATLTDLYAITKICLNEQQQVIEFPKEEFITKNPSELVLKIHDLPVGYELNETETKQYSYRVRFLKNWNDLSSSDVGFIDNTVYVEPTIDNAKILFDDLKNDFTQKYSQQVMSTIGDESFAVRVVSGGIAEAYIVYFRKSNVIVYILSSSYYLSLAETSNYAQIVERRISQ